ncbi:MAG: class I SAM-dependent methyltransferase [Candidatus Zipacnadales bacterium]
MPDEFYDRLGPAYDAIIDWEERLSREGPFLRKLFEKHSVTSVLDTACGTGEHAALFASWGLEVVGADVSSQMIAVCRSKYAGQPIEWVEVGFGEIYDRIGRSFNAVTCLGNSWPHVLTNTDAVRASKDFAQLVSSGGVLVLQQLNYEAMRRRGERLMGPQSQIVNGRETLFLRIFDLDREPIRFTMVRMTQGENGWTREDWQTEHRAWTADELRRLLSEVGFRPIVVFGDFTGSQLDAETSEQIIIVATRA